MVKQLLHTKNPPSVLELIPIPYCSISKGGILNQANLAFEELTGLQQSDWVDIQFKSLIAQSHHGPWEELIVQVQQMNRHLKRPVPILTKKGVERATMIMVIPNHQSEGFDLIIEAPNQDDLKLQGQKMGNPSEMKQVSNAEENKLKQELQHLKIQQKQLEKELGQFAYSVSHDLRAPLRHIDGFSQILAKKESRNLSDRGKEYLGIILKSTARLHAMIEGLLQYSRSRSAKIQSSNFVLEERINSLIHEIEFSGKYPNAKWEIGELGTIYGDWREVKKILKHLCDNALKFSSKQANSTIKIDCLDRENDVVISVEDNGVGFDMAYSDKVFTILQRAHTQSEFEGIGMGLATAKRLVELHGGKIWAESEIDKGATFYFSIPKNRK